MTKVLRVIRHPDAFTLIELLVAMTVLTLLVLMVGQLITGTTSVTVGNRRHLDADSQARLTFDRMAIDIAGMLRRPDVDCLFSRPTGGTNQGISDRMFFYSEAPAFYDGDASTLQSRSSVALLGYRVNAAYQLERLGKLLTWDGLPKAGTGSGSTAPGGIMFLSCPSAALNPDPLSTLAGNWPATFGSSSDSPPYNGSDNDYRVLADQVFRMEICYLLKPVRLNTGATLAAAYSGIPVATPTDRTNNLTATQAPLASDDIAKYVAGSRWYDTRNGRPYICVNNTSGAAVWNPLGMQDVAGIVVTIAVLDAASAKVLPTSSTTINEVSVTFPNLVNVASAFSDVPETATPGTDKTVPDLTITPPRLTAEAWNNALTSSSFASTVKIPQVTAGQIRIYQRCFPLNGN